VVTLQPSDVHVMGFEAFVAARGAALVRFAILLTGDDHRAEDLVQEALAKAYLRWSRIRRADDPEVYVRRLVLNGSRSWWRRRTNREVPVERAPDATAPGDLSGETADRDEPPRCRSNSGPSSSCATTRTSTTRPSRRSWSARRRPCAPTPCAP
jgi:DNA-directed RNA polymerase specialized sigma24 family protein